MPVEIRELVIKAVVTTAGSEDGRRSGSGQMGDTEYSEELVRQILEDHEHKNER